MSDTQVSGRVGPSTATQKRIGRTVGYLIAIAVNVVIAWLINVWPGWEAVPFLTPETAEVVPLVNGAIAVTIVANLVYIVVDTTRVKAFGELVINAVNIAVTVTLLQVFPFDFSAYAFPWTWLVRFILILVLVGTGIALLVNLFKLVRGPAAAR
jgi:ABC-type glycerol-3-phosphate transport system permease component